MIKHEATATLPIPAAEVDLAEWLATLTDEDYQASAKGHRAAGVHWHGDQLGMVNVESVGGTLLVQHYHAVEAGPSRVEMLSPASTGYLMNLVPVGVHVRWVLALTPATATSCTLSCRVEVGLPSPVRHLTGLLGTARAIRRHTEEETVGFAADILAKAGARAVARAAR
ncbi:hypothetical protein [Crossiella cryophila]|uniref:SRPBCC family protein n=1 Tax=Crossiella cryophila TaxID=43355 RepID=A0A7W7CCV4_9PSEU|nr:hypothetical protein [Crossiella cryophila]MBB4678764.1 hypothetical protein [Crossiella cryophila]